MILLQVGLIILLTTALLVNDYYLISLAISLLYIVYCLFRNFKKRLFIFILSISLIFLRYHQLTSNIIPNSKILGYVYQIESNGYVVKALNTSQRYLVYTDELLGVNDIIGITGEIQKVTSLRNFNVFNYQKYMHNQHIDYYFSNPSIEIIYRSKVAGILSRYIKSSDNELLKSYLYSSNDIVSYESIFFSSGMHFSFLFAFCTQVLGFYFYEKDVKVIVRYLKLIFVMLFPYTFSLMRILLMDVLMSKQVSKEHRDFIYIAFFCIIDPYYVTSFSFLIPLLFYLTSYFRNDTSKIVYNIIILLPVYSVMNNSISIVTVLLFSVLRKIYNWFFLISLLCLFLPISSSIIYDVYLRFLDILKLLERYDIVLIIGRMNILFIIFYYFLVLLMKGNKRFIYACLLVFTNYLFISTNLFPTITILDVGQGDSILVEYPFNKATILIDTGGNLYRDIASEVTIPYLHSKAKNSLDIVFLSHDDFDHSGAFDSLVNHITISNVVREVEENIIYKIDENNYINLYHIGRFEDENDNSLIMTLHFKDKVVFTAGDITKELEKRIIRYDEIGEVDIMKLSHHGSATSNSKEFLWYLRPKLAVNSSGINNFYKHPSISVIDNLEELGIPYLDTQTVGAIQIKFIGEIVLIRTMNNEMYAIM